MKIYIVCEDYTCAFHNIFTNKEEANKEAKEIGGYVLTAKVDPNGRIVDRDWM